MIWPVGSDSALIIKSAGWRINQLVEIATDFCRSLPIICRIICTSISGLTWDTASPSFVIPAHNLTFSGNKTRRRSHGRMTATY